MNKSIAQAKWQKLASKVKRPWGGNAHSPVDKPVVGTDDTAGKATGSHQPGPKPKDSGHD